jgi:hypothetical protein
MRVVAIGILALVAAGCAPAGQFDLVPRDPDAPWQAGGRWVGIESSRATVSASYDRAWLGHLIFDAEVVNQTDSTFVVDPEQFSLALASSAGNLPKGLRRRIPAESPDRVDARVARESAAGTGLSDAVMGFAGLVLGTAVLVALAAGDADLTTSESADITSSQGPAVDPRAARRAEANHERDLLPEVLLHRTELAPGQSVRGELWFDARGLLRVMGTEQSDEPRSEWSITSTPPRTPARYALRLRAPAVTGAPEIEYFVCAE